MLLHALSFGLVTLGYFSTFVSLFFENNEQLQAVVIAAIPICIETSYVPLFLILWKLGTGTDQRENESDFPEVMTQTFDQDDSLQANIWNLFVRKKPGAPSVVTIDTLRKSREQQSVGNLSQLSKKTNPL